MCDASSDPTTYDPPKRPACERWLWLNGRERACGMEFGVTTWRDATGVAHTGCRHHWAELQHRYPPVAVPA